MPSTKTKTKTAKPPAEHKQRKRKAAGPKKSRPTIVYEMGCPLPARYDSLAPAELRNGKRFAGVPNADRLMEEMKNRLPYINALVDEELIRRREINEVLRQHVPQLVTLEAEFQAAEAAEIAAEDALKRVRQRKRDRSTEPELAEALKTCRKVAKAAKKAVMNLRAQVFCRKRLAAARVKLTEAQLSGNAKKIASCERAVERQQQLVQTCPASLQAKGELIEAALAEIQLRSNERRREAYGASSLFWGSKVHIAGTTGASIRKGLPPRRQHYDGNGALSVQVRASSAPWDITVGEFFANGHRDVFVEGTVDWEAVASKSRTRRRQGGEVQLHMRIGGTDKHPVMVTFPLRFHRPIPLDGYLKWVHLRRRKLGASFRWYVQFVVSRDGGFGRPTGTQRVGVDLGWRLQPNGLRVAYYQGDDGQHGELVLPQALLDRFRYVDELKSRMDTGFDEIRAVLVDWLHCNERRAPEWLLEATETLARWKSGSRLATLVWQWRSQRFAADAAIFPRLEAWRRDNKRLYQQSSHIRRRTIGRRNQLYFNFAAELRKHYGEVCLEDIDWRKFAKRNLPEEPGEAQQVRWQRFCAAVSKLSAALQQSSMRVTWRPAEYTTMRCHLCGHVDRDIDAAPQVLVVCPGCNVEFDQDRRAGYNLLDGLSVPSRAVR